VNAGHKQDISRTRAAGSGGRASAEKDAISEGAPEIRALLVVLSTLPVGDVPLAAPVLVRDVDGVRDHGSRDTGDSHQEKPLHVNSRATRDHVNSRSAAAQHEPQAQRTPQQL